MTKKEILKEFHKQFDEIKNGDDLYCHYEKGDEQPNLESFIEWVVGQARKSH